jgi:PAS domain S-box-containing protein
MKKIARKSLKTNSEKDLRARIAQLESRLAEAEETLRAIREGEVDALVIETPQGQQTFTLTGAEAPYRLMVETMNEGAATILIDGTIIYCNKRFADILKTSLENVIGCSIHQFIKTQKGTSPNERASMLSAESRKQIFLQAADGAPIPVLLSVSGFCEGSASVCMLVTDISELQKLHQALQESHSNLEVRIAERTRALLESEERLRSVLDNSQDVIYRLNLETGRYDYISPSVLEVTGFSADELMAHDVEKALMMIHPDDRPGVLAALAHLEGVGHARLEYRQQTKSGEYRWISNSMSLIRDDEGRALYRNGNIRDINESIHAEEALMEQAAKLEELNKELESFSYSVSHDLQAPLRAIDGFSRKLARDYGDKLDHAGIHLIDVIRDNTKKMGTLIKDLLSFSRVQKNNMNISEINMNMLVNEVWNEIQAECQEREINFVATNILSGQGDRALVRQVLYNLISNAVKFTRNQKQSFVEMSSHQDHNGIVYCLKDNGVGFDMAHYEKLFGVFQRLHRDEEYEGTGIGLALVHRIVKRHGGRVWAEGEVNKGATFYFMLPASPPPDEARAGNQLA